MKPFSRESQSTIANCLLFIAILLLWIYKFPFLSLPYFTDEAWSYTPAVWAMYQNHPCLLPGCIPADLYRGHPLWFYFMNAVVAKVFGFSPLVVHLFALTISSVFLLVFFFILLRFTNPAFAMMGALLLLSQEVFIVQSSFMLPEIFISMMTMVTIYSLYTGRNFLYFLFATLLVLTKESGLVITAAACIAAFSVSIKSHRQDSTKRFLSLVKYFFILLSPLLIGIAFFVLQEKICGWYFYPLHIQLMNFNMDSIIQKLFLIRDFVFLQQGRKILVPISGLILILLLLYLRRWKSAPATGILKISWILLIVFAVYFFFSLINFIALRYLIPLIAIFIFLVTIWSYQLHRLGIRFFPWLICAATGIALYNDFTSDHSWIDDVSMTYMDDVIVDQQAVEFMEDEHANSKKIFTFFMMQYNLTNPELSYLHGSSFKNVSSDVLSKDADYYIFSDLMLNESNYNYAKSNDSLLLKKRFEKGKAWCEIYARK